MPFCLIYICALVPQDGSIVTPRLLRYPRGAKDSPVNVLEMAAILYVAWESGSSVAEGERRMREREREGLRCSTHEVTRFVATFFPSNHLYLPRLMKHLPVETCPQISLCYEDESRAKNKRQIKYSRKTKLERWEKEIADTAACAGNSFKQQGCRVGVFQFQTHKAANCSRNLTQLGKKTIAKFLHWNNQMPTFLTAHVCSRARTHMHWNGEDTILHSAFRETAFVNSTVAATTSMGKKATDKMRRGRSEENRVPREKRSLTSGKRHYCVSGFSLSLALRSSSLLFCPATFCSFFRRRLPNARYISDRFLHVLLVCSASGTLTCIFTSFSPST